MVRRIDLPLEEVTRRYTDGAPLRELAAVYQVSTKTVRHRLAAAGVQVRRRGAPRREVDLAELVYETHLAGSTRAAARSLGLNRVTAQRRLNELRQHDQQLIHLFRPAQEDRRPAAMIADRPPAAWRAQ